MADYTLLNRDQLRHYGTIWEFQGQQYNNTEVSFFWVDMPPGNSVPLHQHPYPEIFITLAGAATYTIGGETVEIAAGQIVIVPADVPHKFINSGSEHLHQINIHANRQITTQWLKE